MIYKLKKLIEKRRQKHKLHAMDKIWSMYGGNCFGSFPPSFYAKHTEEERELIAQKNIEKLKQILEEYENSIRCTS